MAEASREPRPLLFFGTPEFALPTLEALCAAGRAPARVITRPPRPVGRGRELRQPPVAELARRLGLPVSQPERIVDPAFLELAAGERPWLAVVVAFGQIFPPALLRLPEAGCVNLHASLLPRYRGAAPVQAAIAAGEGVTGVTTMLMEEGLDSGPILLQEEIEIGPRETSPELSKRLAAAGGRLMIATLERLERGDLEPRAQDPELVSWAPRLSKEDGWVDWQLGARRLFDRLRAYTPWPGLTASLRDEPVKILSCEPLDEKDAGRPGEVLGLRRGRLAVRCGEGSVLGLARLQRPGRKALEAGDFARGERLRPGERFT